MGAFNGGAIAEITKNALGYAWTLASYSPWQVCRPGSVRWVFLGTLPGEFKDLATARSMPQVVAITRAPVCPCL